MERGEKFIQRGSYKSAHVLLNLLKELRKRDKTMRFVEHYITFSNEYNIFNKLEDLKVLRRSPDLLNNVKIGQGQLQLIKEQICFYHIHFGQVI